MADDTMNPPEKPSQTGQAAVDLLEEQMKRQYPNMDEHLRRSLAKIGASIAAKDVKKAEAQSAQVIRLPICRKAARGTPNSFLRGALFAAIQGKERGYLKGELLASREGVALRFTGMQLDQLDLDVWEQAVELVREQPLGHVCQFSIYGFLKAMGRSTSQKEHDWLKNALRRLTATCVEITHGRYTYAGGMLEFAYDENLGLYSICMNPRIFALYEAGWTAIDWEVRQKLRRKPLALWLHGYLSSDAENYPTQVETIRRLCGSKTKALKHFKANLKAALHDLEAATEGQMGGSISEEGLVEWRRRPTPSQARHLAQKKAGQRTAQPKLVAKLLPVPSGSKPDKEPKK